MLVYSVNILLSLGIVVGALAWRTNHLSSFTYEANRRASVESTPIELSDWKLQDSHGEIVRLSELSGNTLLVDFVYTRCPTICRALGSRYQQLQRVIEASGNEQITLLSISIDPDYDTPENLALYRKRYKGQEDTWLLARPIDDKALRTLIAETGLRVIPDEFGGLMHSDAIHLMEGRSLVKIDDWDSSDWERVINSDTEFES